MRGVQHLGVVVGVRRGRGADSLREQLPGGAEIARGAQGEGPVLDGCEGEGWDTWQCCRPRAAGRYPDTPGGGVDEGG